MHEGQDTTYNTEHVMHSIQDITYNIWHVHDRCVHIYIWIYNTYYDAYVWYMVYNWQHMLQIHTE